MIGLLARVSRLFFFFFIVHFGGDMRKGGLGPCFCIGPGFSLGGDGSLEPLGIRMSQLPAILPNRKIDKSVGGEWR